MGTIDYAFEPRAGSAMLARSGGHLRTLKRGGHSEVNKVEGPMHPLSGLYGGKPLRSRVARGQEGRLILKTTGLPSKIEYMQSGIGELVFDVIQDQDGGFVAECLSESIVTEADTWQELRANVKEAVSAFFFDGSPPERIRLHLVRDEVFTVS